MRNVSVKAEAVLPQFKGNGGFVRDPVIRTYRSE
jgi:hypothetical protein